MPGVSGPALPADDGFGALDDDGGSGHASDELPVMSEVALISVSSASLSILSTRSLRVGIS